MMPVELTVVTVTYSTTFATFMNLTHGEIYFGKPCSFSFFFFFLVSAFIKEFFLFRHLFSKPFINARKKYRGTNLRLTNGSPSKSKFDTLPEYSCQKNIACQFSQG